MDTINTLIYVLRSIIIPAGVIFRVIYCLIKMMYSEDEYIIYKKRIINIILFGMISEMVFVVKNVILWYYD